MRNLSIDVGAATENGVIVRARRRGYPTAAINLRLIHSLARNITLKDQKQVRFVAANAWHRSPDRVLGIMGLGRIGSDVAQWGCHWYAITVKIQHKIAAMKLALV